MSKIFNIPNILSMFRLALIPVFIVMYFREEYWFAVSIVAIAGLTDVVDGYIARHFNMITVLGKILDPLADKLMQVSVLICLAITHPMVRPMAAIHLAKETAMLIGGVWLFRKQRKPYSARWWGKMSTVVIVCTLILIIFDDIYNGYIPFGVIVAGMVISVASMIFAFVSYLVYGLKLKNAQCEEK